MVLAGSGIGNTSPELGDAIADAIDSGVPSLSRHGVTTVLSGHRTAVPAGDLPPWKARSKFGLALSACDDQSTVRTAFEDHRSMFEDQCSVLVDVPRYSTKSLRAID
uniref:hypothetical protein n=1 Tax=Salinadaptatus halalkaliphilus TaxID=2419781 RepID=UPI003741ED2D